jgi:hypothetical protein
MENRFFFKLEVKHFASMVFILLLYASCTKQEEVVTPLSCYDPYGTDADSTTFANELIGKWSWQFKRSIGFTVSVDSIKHKGMIIEFLPNGRLNITRPNQPSMVISWKLVKKPYEIKTDTVLSPLIGTLFLCEDVLTFNTSQRDGPDNIFKKTR